MTRLLFSLSILCLLALPATATAECTSDADCPAGLQCQEVEQACDSPAVPGCTCACAEDEPDCACDCPAPAEPEPCEPSTVKLCTFVECTSNDQCAENYSCQVTSQVCSGSGGTGCVCPPCEAGAECPSCECDEEPTEPTEPECTVESQHCLPDEVACTTDGECPGGWVCEELPSSGGDCLCTSPACPPDAPDCGEPEPDCTCDEPETEQACLPEGLLQSIQDGKTEAPAVDEANGGRDFGGEGPQTPGTPEDSAGGDGSGQPTSDGSGGSGNRTSNAGCTATSGAPASGAALLVFALLAMLAIRRRA